MSKFKKAFPIICITLALFGIFSIINLGKTTAKAEANSPDLFSQNIEANNSCHGMTNSISVSLYSNERYFSNDEK